MSVRPNPFRVTRARPLGCSRSTFPMAVIPAQAGIHFRGPPKSSMDSRFRGNDGVMKVLSALEGCK